jgi:hypothetical protein
LRRISGGLTRRSPKGMHCRGCLSSFVIAHE